MLAGDTVTKPGVNSLLAIAQAKVGDDVYGEDITTNDLEEYMSKRTGHESSLFVMSGTMGNQIAIRTHLVQPPYSVLCDESSHIITSEAGGVSMWTGATVYPVAPQNGQFLTLEDVKAHYIPGANSTYGYTRTGNPAGINIHSCPTKLISLEVCTSPNYVFSR